MAARRSRETQQPHWRQYHLLGSTASEETASDTDREEEEEGENAFISFTPVETRCEQLYERGLKLSSRGKLPEALTCFLECMDGMQECQYFAKLPHTLHELAGVYHSLGHYDKAVEFVQAEKLFYEAVIIDMEEEEGKKDGAATTTFPSIAAASGRKRPRRKSEPEDYGDLLIKKADEFDKLSRVCSRESRFELALDYCGKAVKIRQSVFGSEHPSTLSLLDHFTVLYAQVGQKQYASAFHQAMADPAASSHPGSHKASGDSTHSSVDCNTSKCVDAVCSGTTDVPPFIENKGSIRANTTMTCTDTTAAVANTASEAVGGKGDCGLFEEPVPLQTREETQTCSAIKGSIDSSTNECGIHTEPPTVNTTEKHKETDNHSNHLDANRDSIHGALTQPLKLTQPLQGSAAALQTAKGLCPPLWVFLMAVLVQVLLVVFLMS